MKGKRYAEAILTNEVNLADFHLFLDIAIHLVYHYNY